MNTVRILAVIVIVMVLCFLIYKSQDVQRIYKAGALQALERVELSRLIQERDLQHLPDPVKKYLTYAGVIGKPTVQSLRFSVEGQFRMVPKPDWIGGRIEQYNFFGNQPGRLSLMTLKVKGIPMFALDTYQDGKGSMLGKLAGLFTVVTGSGPEMDKGELAVLLCEMCCFPPTLIDQRIQWETIDTHTVRASFDDKNNKVSALLFFNEKGELIKCTTDDKGFQEADGSFRDVSWSILCGDYREIDGLKISTTAEAVWHFPEGDFSYGKLQFKEFEFNAKKFK